MATQKNGKRTARSAAAVLLLLAVCLVNYLFLCLRYPDSRVALAAGEVLSEDLLYPFSGTDPYRTDQLRQAARDKTEPIYRLDQDVIRGQELKLAGWFEQYSLFLKEMTLLWENGAQEYNGYLYNQTAWNMLIRETELQAKLSEYGLSDALDTAMAYTILNTFLPRSSLHAAGDMPDILPVKAAVTSAILSGMEAGVREQELSNARYQAKEKLKQTSLPAVTKTELAGNLIDTFFIASAVVDQVETEKARSAAADAVAPVAVKKGTVLLRAGTVISEQDLAHLEAIDMLKSAGSGGRYGIYLLYLVPIYLVYGLYLLLFEREIVFSPLVMVRLCLLLVLTLAFVWVFTLFESPIAPILLGVLMIAATHDRPTAQGANVLLALTGSLLLPESGLMGGEAFAAVAGTLLMGQVTLSVLAVDARPTARVLAAILGGSVGGIVMAVPRLLSGQGLLAGFMAFGLLFIGALIALVLSIGLTAIWEIIFGLPSETKLNELLNMDNPLQRRLMNNAPGTYHHCQMTALLAENGAQSIGAKALLAKAAAAVHDVGKLKSPRHFSENQANGINPHDTLPPEESARIIIAHVADGDAILQRYKVPAAVRDIVREHHGTTMAAYFYYKAKNSGAAVNEADFRYPGPRPSSRESAILMLADSCEAAVRSLGNPSPGEVKDMVHRVFRGKMDDGQLVNSALTLSELSRVEEAFLQTLSGILHGRISYPKEEA